MKYKVGFIGCGNMASAIIGGLKSHAGITASEIIAADASEAARTKAAEVLGFKLEKYLSDNVFGVTLASLHEATISAKAVI